MCGISGAWFNAPGQDAPGIAARMIHTMAHRGPDGQQVWHDPNANLALAHARLAIVDLSPAGEQPMQSVSGRYVIVLNGEIYNHMALRRELDSRSGGSVLWRGHSDTETFLAAVEAWGLDTALQAAVGMFAFALWDKAQHSLTLTRDRFGEKPLYFAVTPHGLLFGSELKSLMATRLISGRLSRQAAAQLLRYNNIPAPLSVFEDVQKLCPGHSAVFSSPGGPAENRCYWSVDSAWRAGLADPFTGTDADAVAQLKTSLSETIRDQMLADVPLGAFLSGGIDSSTIVALMQAQSSRPIRTFSIGFEMQAYNEAEAAKAVASHLGTDHTELYVTPRDALEVIPRLPAIYCEPFADSSQIPTHLVAAMARRHVTVALSGDAGDEVFGGYNRYLFGPMVNRRLAPWPRAVRKILARVMGSVSPEGWDRLIGGMSSLLPGPLRFTHAGEKLGKLARALDASGPDDLYTSFISHWPEPSKIVSGTHESHIAPDWNALGLGALSFSEQMMYQDAIGYLPNDILTKVDRATMAVSLESRAPFLDHRVYEFAARLPLNMKIRGGVTKWLVRQILYQHVPAALIDRPKAGFGIPLEHWLRGELREWAESLLSPEALSRTGMFDVAIVRHAWAQHLSAKRNLQHALWCVLMYQAWHAAYMA